MENASTRADTKTFINDQENEEDDLTLKMFNLAAGDYLTTNILHQRNINISDVQVEQLKEENITNFEQQIITQLQKFNFEKVMIDPRQEWKIYKKQQSKEPIIPYAEVALLVEKAKQVYLDIKPPHEENKFDFGIFDHQHFIKLAKDVKYYHKGLSKRRIIEEKDLLQERYNSKKRLRFNKMKVHNSQFQAIAREVSYLHNFAGVSIQNIGKRLALSYSFIKRILNPHQLYQNSGNNDMIKYTRFKKIHGRARKFIQKLLDDASSPIQSTDIQTALQKEMKLKLSKSMIQRYLHDELHLSYKLIRSIDLRHNEMGSKIQRQFAAKHFINLLYEGKRIINVDESILNLTDNRRRGWCPKEKRAYTIYQQRLNKVSVIAAITSYGEFFYTINCGMNNTFTFQAFLVKLIIVLDRVEPLWRQDTVIMIDNAQYHRSRIMMEKYKQLNIPIMFLGPYQFGMAPVELMHSYIKNRDLNPLKTRLSNKQDQYMNNLLRKFLMMFIKEVSVLMSKFPRCWLMKCFSHVLTNALECLELKEI